MEFPPDWERGHALEWMADALRDPLLEASHRAFMERADERTEFAIGCVEAFSRRLRLEASAGEPGPSGEIAWRMRVIAEADAAQERWIEEAWGSAKLPEPDKGPWAEASDRISRRKFGLLRSFLEAGEAPEERDKGPKPAP